MAHSAPSASDSRQPSIEHRRELDRLEAELRVSHPDLAWSDELQSLKAEADAAIKALTP